MMQLALSLLLLFTILASFFFSPVVISSFNSSEDPSVVLRQTQQLGAGAKPIEHKSRSTDLVVPDVRSLVPVLAGVGPASRSLLDSESVVQGKVLLVHEDGKLELKDTGSESTLWEIQTDDPLPSLEQVFYPSDSEYFLFPGKGSELLVFTKGSGLKKHPLTIEEYVSRTPEIKGSNVIIGSKSSTLYTINADTGEVIYKNTLPVNLSQFRVSMDQDPSLPSLETGTDTETGTETNLNNYITIVRTDYSVSCSEFGKTIWNWSKSFFIAYYPNRNKYMLEPPKNNGALIPIKIGAAKRELLLADTFSEYTQLNEKNAIKGPSEKLENGLVLGPIETINEKNENSLIISEKSFKSEENRTESRIKFLLAIPFFCIIILVIYPKLNGSNGSGQKELTESNPRQNKKKKSRKNSVAEKENKLIIAQDSSNSEGEKLSDSQIKEKLLAYMQNLSSTDGKWVNKLFVSNKEIGRGSNGTVVLEGFYEGRTVAIKRLLYSHHEIALKEIKNLIASDQHNNIVRLYGVEQDYDFVYISLERCSCSLADLVQTDTVPVQVRGEREIVLWRENGFPSPQLLKLMRDIVSGLAHLHELGIIHRDMKPQNVLISSDGVIKAKLSDMGISKRLQDDMSALSHQATGCGSSGWQAPEQLLHGRQSRAVDLFSLGCILFFCITKGKHPFGDYFERDRNIIKNEFDLFLLDFIPEAVHLLSLLLNPDPLMRPKAIEVLNHPFFWTSELRLSFLRDTSDRIDKANEPDLINALENISTAAFGGKWNEKLDQALISDLGKYRKYNFDSVRDLLRVIRNKSGHYRELSSELQESLGSLPDGFDRYFSSRFPKLLIEVYKVISAYCREEDSFSKYFKSSVQ